MIFLRITDADAQDRIINLAHVASIERARAGLAITMQDGNKMIAVGTMSGISKLLTAIPQRVQILDVE